MYSKVLRFNRDQVFNKNMKRIIYKILQAAVAGVVIIILGTLGIDAVDHYYNNKPESIISRFVFGPVKESCPEVWS